MLAQMLLFHSHFFFTVSSTVFNKTKQKFTCCCVCVSQTNKQMFNIFGVCPSAPSPNRLSDYKIWLFSFFMFDSLFSTRWQNFDFPLQVCFFFCWSSARLSVSRRQLLVLFVTFFRFFFWFYALRYEEYSRWIYFYLCIYILLLFRVRQTFSDPNEFQMHVSPLLNFNAISRHRLRRKLLQYRQLFTFIITRRTHFSNISFNSMQISILTNAVEFHRYELTTSSDLNFESRFIALIHSRKICYTIYTLSEFQCQLKLSIWFYLRVLYVFCPHIEEKK